MVRRVASGDERSGGRIRQCVAVLKLGLDEPSYSMDSSGKLVYTSGSEVLTSTLQTAVEDATPEDARIPLPPRELGSKEIKVYRNCREKKDGASKDAGACGIHGVHGGPMLGARGGIVVVWDWETGNIVRRVDVKATNVSFVSFPGHLLLTDPTDFLVRYWYPCRYCLKGLVPRPSI